MVVEFFFFFNKSLFSWYFGGWWSLKPPQPDYLTSLVNRRAIVWRAHSRGLALARGNHPKADEWPKQSELCFICNKNGQKLQIIFTTFKKEKWKKFTSVRGKRRAEEAERRNAAETSAPFNGGNAAKSSGVFVFNPEDIWENAIHSTVPFVSGLEEDFTQFPQNGAFSPLS